MFPDVNNNFLLKLTDHVGPSACSEGDKSKSSQAGGVVTGRGVSTLRVMRNITIICKAGQWRMALFFLSINKLYLHDLLLFVFGTELKQKTGSEVSQSVTGLRKGEDPIALHRFISSSYSYFFP